MRRKEKLLKLPPRKLQKDKLKERLRSKGKLQSKERLWLRKQSQLGMK